MKNKKKCSIGTLVFIIMCISLLLYMSLFFNDADVYYFVSNGNYILKHGIPHTNPFIFIPYEGMHLPKIVIQNWLYCVFIAIVNKCFGSIGMVITNFLFLLGTILITLYFLKPRHKNKISVFVIVLCFLLTFSYTSLRPQMFTYILIVAEILLIEKALKTNNMRWLMLIIPLMILEINCHASYWIMHYIVFIPYLIPADNVFKIFKKTKVFRIKNAVNLIITWIMMAGSLFINPYGIDAILYVFKALKSNVFSIVNLGEELSPFNIKTFGLEFNVIILGIIIIFAFMIFKRKITSTTFLMFIGFTFLFLQQYKWLPFFEIGYVFVARDFLDAVPEICKFKIKYQKTIKLMLIIISMIITFKESLTFASGMNKIKNTSELAQFNENAVKNVDVVKINDYLIKNNIDSVYSPYNASENYYEYHGIKVMTDARPELYTMDYSNTDNCDNSYLGLQQQIAKGLKMYSYAVENKTYSESLISQNEYEHLVDDLNVKYYITDSSSLRLALYCNEHPEKYEKIYQGKEKSLYKKINRHNGK